MTKSLSQNPLQLKKLKANEVVAPSSAKLNVNTNTTELEQQAKELEKQLQQSTPMPDSSDDTSTDNADQ
jgi:predicted ATP-grasp superfamily ATP-dependent carboligase